VYWRSRIWERRKRTHLRLALRRERKRKQVASRIWLMLAASSLRRLLPASLRVSGVPLSVELSHIVFHG
jgi:hypothetical protein